MSSPTRSIVRETFDWRGVSVEVSYEAQWLGGDLTAHLEVRSVQPEKAPLPITATGYRSRFILPEVVEKDGGPVAYVRLWLDETAKDRKWIETEFKARQLSLF